MILMDEMLPLKLYSKKQRAYLPFNPSNKKKNAMITLLTQSIEDSIDLINCPFFMNPNYFISYYMDRNVKRYLSNDGKIEIEGEADDPEEEGFAEAVLRSAPSKNAPVCTFVTTGTPNDARLLEDNFKKKAFNKWYDFFHVPKPRRRYPTVYGCMDMKQMFDAIGTTAIMSDSKLIANSYNSDAEIFVLNASEYTMKNSDGPYEMYCESAIITYVINIGYPKCSWELANAVAAALSGQADYLYKKNNYHIKDDEKISVALYISKLYKEKGKTAIVELVRTRNLTPIARYGAKGLVDKFKPKATEEATIYPSIVSVYVENLIDDMRHEKEKHSERYRDEFTNLKKIRLGKVHKFHSRPAINAERLQVSAEIVQVRKKIKAAKERLDKIPGSDDNLIRKTVALQIVDMEDYLTWINQEYIPALNKRSQELEKAQKKLNRESVLFETDGTYIDTMNVYNDLNDRDRTYVSSDGAFGPEASKAAIYRHIERDELYQLKGFIEIYKSAMEPYVAIAVRPAFRKQGVAGKLVKTMLKEFHQEHPEYRSIVWSANSKNKPSIGLAQKMGFKTIKVTDNLHCLRYEYKPNELYACIPDEILNETDLTKYCRNHFNIDYSAPTDVTYKIRDLKSIVRSKNINKFELGYFMFVALRKMGYPCRYALLAEVNGTMKNPGDIEPVVFCDYGDMIYYFNALAPYYGQKGIMTSIDPQHSLEYFNKFHAQRKWGNVAEYPAVFCVKTFDDVYDIEVGKSLYTDYVVPAMKETFHEGTTDVGIGNPMVTPPGYVNNKLPIRLSHLKKIRITDKVVEKYGGDMKGLNNVTLTNHSTGFLYVDKNDIPVCFFNVQQKHMGEDGNPVVWLQAIEVAEEHKGQSLGRQLLQTAVSDHNVTNLSVDKDNQIAIRLYKSMGLDIYNMNGNQVHMRKVFTKMESWRPPESMCMRLEDQLFVFENDAPIPLTEALSQTAYNTKLRQYLWKQRLRTSSAQVEIFQQIKAQCPKIRKTYINPKMYKGLNIFLDMSYYNGLFLMNNRTTKDIAINFYWEYLNRMINSTDEYFRTTYTKNTIFIPVWKGAWDCKPNTFVYDWKDNLNPISMIFRMIRKNPAELKKWGSRNFIFVGRTGYFRVDFEKFQLKDLVKFKTRLNKLWNQEPIEDDEDEDGYGRTPNQSDEEHSTAAIAVKAIDDIEQSTGIQIDDVSKAVKPAAGVANKNDPTALEIVPNLRIRTSKIPSIGEPMCIAVVAPTTTDVAQAVQPNAIPIKSDYMHYIYKK